MRPHGVQQWLSVGIVVALAVAIIVVTALHVTSSDRTYEPAWQPHPSVSADGRSIELTYTGGSCDESARVLVDETPDAVTLTIRVTERKGKAACPGVGLRRTITADLTSPLGSRSLEDGAPAASQPAGRT